MRVLVFGDSITQGFCDTEGGWVARLRKHYDKLQLNDPVNNYAPEIFNLGISGDIAPGILKRLEPEWQARAWLWPRERFAFIIAIGINDSVVEEGKPRFTENEYRSNLNKILAKAKKHSDKILLVGLSACDETLTAPISWKDRHYLNQRVKAFEDITRKVAVSNKVSFAPVFDKFKKHFDAGENLLADGLHPNNDGHELIFQLVRPELEKLLRKQ